jgi:hypothetical protein
MSQSLFSSVTQSFKFTFSICPPSLSMQNRHVSAGTIQFALRKHLTALQHHGLLPY